MKRTILAVMLAGIIISPAFGESGTKEDPYTFRMPLLKETEYPMGQKNACAYGWVDAYTVFILAPDANKKCPSTILWKEWDATTVATGRDANCEYDFPRYGPAIAHDMFDNKTQCYASANITFNPAQ